MPIATEPVKPAGTRISERFWHVYNHVAKGWYEHEHGQLELHDRWYHPAMIFLELYAACWTVPRILEYLKRTIR